MLMLNGRFLRPISAIFSIATLLALQLLSTGQALAAVAIVVSPTSGPVGSSITVTGTVDANGNAFEIQWDGMVIQTGAAASGSNSVSSSITVPTTTGGVHTVTLKDTVTNMTASTTFTVTPAIAINPTSGTVGTTITVNGTGFDASETGISVTFAGRSVATASSDTTGSWSATFTIPDSPSGVTHAVTATRSSGTTVTASQNITVIPSFTLAPTSGPVGTSATVTGKGFAASETITVTIDGESVKTGIATDANGSWQSTFTLPDSPGGTRSIGVYGSTTAASGVTPLAFTVTPQITMNPGTGSAGTQVTVTGTGFAAGETGITVMFGNIAVGQGLTASPTGRWSATFVIPVMSGGGHSVTAYGSITSASQVAGVSFTVTARIAIGQTSGVVGDTVNVTGQSFGANETGINILYDGTPVASNIRASATGDWTATFTVPPSPTGNHRVGASGPFTTAASVPEQSFTVSPKLSVTPTSGAVGTQITITGTGFAASRPTTITFDNQPVTLSSGTTQSTAKGSITATFNAPKSKGGPHKIIVSDGSSQLSSDWTMESTPPPIPTPSKPSNGELIGWFGDDPVAFRWAEVQDPSGISYTLQVSTDETFSSLAIKQDGLTKPEFISSPLPLGVYHWRVRAIDGADNASDWSPVMSVRVGIMPMWAFIAIAALVFAVLIAVIILLVGRRGRVAPGMKRARIRKTEPEPLSEPGPEPPEEAEEASEETASEPEIPVRAAPPRAAPQAPPVPETSQAEIDEIVLKVVDGLTDADISLLSQNEDLKRRGWTLAKLYKAVGRLEQEGKLVRGQDEKYRRAVPTKGKAAPFAPEPEPPLKRASPPQPEEVSEKEREEPKETPKARPATAPARKAAEPEPTPPPPAGDITDPEIEQLVADSVVGMSDADITQIAQSELIRSRGLTLARVYKIVGHLEKDGRLVRDEKGHYQKASGKTATKPPAKETAVFAREKPQTAEETGPTEAVGMDDYKPLEKPVEKPPVAREAKPPLKPVGITEELYDIVIEAIVDQTDADIPQIAQRPDLKSRGLNLARLYQIATRLEKDGKITRDDTGHYRRSTGKPPTAEPPRHFTTIEWSGKLPWQQWTQFYTRILSAYLAEEGLSISVNFRVGPGASISSERLDETRAALRELKLSDEVRAEPQAGATARFSSIEWSGNLPWQNWEAFFAKVLSRFLAETTLSVSVGMKAVSKAGFSQSSADQTASALKELALSPSLKVS